MLNRVVMWRVNGNSAAERLANCQHMQFLLESMRGKIPGMQALNVFINEDTSKDAADIIFITEFSSLQALEEYETHPEHEKIKPHVRVLRNERRVVMFET